MYANRPWGSGCGGWKSTRLQPRPYHPKKDPEAEATFKKPQQLGKGRVARLGRGQGDRDMVPGRSESGAARNAGIHLGAGRLWRCGTMTRVYLFGALCPSRATGTCDHHAGCQQRSHERASEEIAMQVAAGAHAVLVCDGAGWHQRSGPLDPRKHHLVAPAALFTGVEPDGENVWDYLRGNNSTTRCGIPMLPSSRLVPRLGTSSSAIPSGSGQSLRVAGRVSMLRRAGISGSTLAPSPHPAHRTGHADLPHPALGQNITPSPTAHVIALIGSDVRARSARKGARWIGRNRTAV